MFPSTVPGSLLLWVALASVVAFPAHGAVTAPQPTPTPTAAGPSADELIARAQRASSHHSPVHFKGVFTSTPFGGTGASIRQQEYGDMRFSGAFVIIHDIIRKRTTTRSHGRTLTRSIYREFVVTRQGSAVRKGSHAAWKCRGRGAPLPTLLDPTSSITLGRAVSKSMLIGTDLLNNIPVWHVQIAGGLFLGSDRFIEDAYIEQSRFLVLKKEITSTAVPTGSRSHVAVHYTHYGERVTIALPRACGQL